MKKNITERLLNCSSKELAKTAETCREINNVTAEEYVNERFKGNTDMYAYHVCKKAIEMARQEEKSIIMKAFQKALDECSHGTSMIECSKVDLIMKFADNL